MVKVGMRQNKKIKQAETCQQHGFSTIELLILGAVTLALVSGFQILQSRSDKDRRDLERLALMREAQTLFSSVYLATGSYKTASVGCEVQGDTLARCSFPSEGVAERFRDPGTFAFTVETVPSDETYAIAFILERAHGKLASGKHLLTPDGIK